MKKNPRHLLAAFLTDDYNTIMDLYKNQEKMGYSVSLFGELVEIRYELNKAMNEEPMEQPWTGGQYIGPVYLDATTGELLF